MEMRVYQAKQSVFALHVAATQSCISGEMYVKLQCSLCVGVCLDSTQKHKSGLSLHVNVIYTLEPIFEKGHRVFFAHFQTAVS